MLEMIKQKFRGVKDNAKAIKDGTKAALTLRHLCKRCRRISIKGIQKGQKVNTIFNKYCNDCKALQSE